MSAYENVIRGKLKLKGKALDVKSAFSGINKKKKKNKHLNKIKHLDDIMVTNDNESILPSGSTELLTNPGQEEVDDASNSPGDNTARWDDHLTPAERLYVEQRAKIDVHRLAKTVNKSHPILDFNQYLANMSEGADYFTIKVQCGGAVEDIFKKTYVGGEVDYFDFIETVVLCAVEFKKIVRSDIQDMVCCISESQTIKLFVLSQNGETQSKGEGGCYRDVTSTSNSKLDIEDNSDDTYNELVHDSNYTSIDEDDRLYEKGIDKEVETSGFRTKKKALDKVVGKVLKQYAMLEAYITELPSANPDSTIVLKIENNEIEVNLAQFGGTEPTTGKSKNNCPPRVSPWSALSFNLAGVNEKNSLGGKEGNRALMFKKKYRFRALSSKPTDKPKGFTGLYDHSDGIEVMSSKDGGAEVLMNGDIGGGVVDSVDDMRQLDLHAGDSRAGRSAYLEEDDERQQALEAIKSSRNAEKKFVTSRFSSFPRVDIFLQSSEVFSKVSLVSLQ
ncbi:hypothetical protein ACH5RR_001412 [Cinchona calisaya]|uniref:Uncharacterized protein n=1 Tax=Cinchona calisaya TaxID=153742 RepID=A0ABD3B3R8_9GENT